MQNIQQLTSGTGITPLTDPTIVRTESKVRTIAQNQNSATSIAQAAQSGPVMNRANPQERNVQPAQDPATTAGAKAGAAQAQKGIPEGPAAPNFAPAVQGCFKLDNINRTANAFLDNTNLTKKIDRNFQDQVKVIQDWVNALNVNFTEYCFSKYEVAFKFIL